MAAFASGRRSPGIRFFVVLLSLIMAFSAVSLPVYALSESVALFGLAAVLSSATAALGFKLINNQQGIDTINRMCADFIKSALAPALVVIGTRVNGLQNDMAYIKMQVKEGKTYLDDRVLAWVQQWLSKDGVYNNNTLTFPDYQVGQIFDVGNLQLKSVDEVLSVLEQYTDLSTLKNLIEHFHLDLEGKIFNLSVSNINNRYATINVIPDSNLQVSKIKSNDISNPISYYVNLRSKDSLGQYHYAKYFYNGQYGQYIYDDYLLTGVADQPDDYDSSFYLTPYVRTGSFGQNIYLSNIGNFDYKSNDTGLSGDGDTIGEDYKDKTLEQILQGLKDHAPDWYDAGADSSTNSTVGAKDLPVTVPAGAATENPALNPDAVYNPPFDQPLDDTRSGATSSTAVADGVTNANTAESSEAAAATVSETQTIIDSLINWANNYISPDKGLFSKFPLCIPYDVYLLVSSALGVDARDISDIVNADTSDIGSLSNDPTAVNPQSDFVPVVDIQHDFNLDGYTYPIRISFDLTPYEPLIKINRIFLSIALIAELIGSEYKRIRWGK